jgi:type II secretory ATPase GspE/PulE/Tfp pilus assembly ATPase PilB-like protein
MAERLYSIQQTADLLGGSPADVRRWIDAGALQAEQLAGDVRVSERSLIRFLKDCGVDLAGVLRAIARENAEPAPEPDDASEAALNAPTRLAEAILKDAVGRGAETIALEPLPDTLTLRLRVGGRWREKPNFASRLPAGLGPLLMARFQALARVSAESGGPPTLEAHLDGRTYFFRIDTCSTPHGDGLLIYPIPS